MGPLRDVCKAAARQAECDSGGAGPVGRGGSEKAGATARDSQWVLRRENFSLVSFVVNCSYTIYIENAFRYWIIACHPRRSRMEWWKELRGRGKIVQLHEDTFPWTSSCQ